MPEELGFTPLHQATEMDQVDQLRELLDAGGDANEEYEGFPLIHHAMDTEVEGHLQAGEPLRATMTAYLLARGADPTRRGSDWRKETAEEYAERRGHWIAAELFRAWGARKGRA